MPYPTPYIAILDVGHGNSAVIRDGEETIVIDCGAKSAGLLEFLDQEGIKKIDKLFISHADQDHIGGLVGVISTGEFIISEIFLNSDGTKGSDVWNDLVYVLDKLHECGETKFIPGIARKKDRIMCGSIGLEIAGPTPYLVAKGVGGKDLKGRIINSNSLSASFKVFWKDNIMAYLAGDIDQVGLDDMIRIGADLRSALLVFPHHGGKAGAGNPVPFTSSLCDIVSPQTIIFSIGRSKFDNPKPEVVKAVKAKIKDVRISCTQLSKHCVKKITVKKLDHLVDVYSRGREDNFCCSGTFVINLDKAVSYFPELDKHQTFIKKATKNALCLED